LIVVNVKVVAYASMIAVGPAAETAADLHSANTIEFLQLAANVMVGAATSVTMVSEEPYAASVGVVAYVNIHDSALGAVSVRARHIVNTIFNEIGAASVTQLVTSAIL